MSERERQGGQIDKELEGKGGQISNGKYVGHTEVGNEMRVDEYGTGKKRRGYRNVYREAEKARWED